MLDKRYVAMVVLGIAVFYSFIITAQVASRNTADSFNRVIILGNTSICYAVSDNTDSLGTVDKTNGTDTLIGPTGVPNIEAIAYQPGDVLYAADAGQLGILNLNTGQFTPLPQPAGSGNGALGTLNFNDIDGLTFDPFRGTLYGTVRRAGNDLLIVLDPVTGRAIPDAFGPGVDYVVIDGPGILEDIDDIAIDPVTGVMYAINDDASSNYQLITVDPATGQGSVIGPIPIDAEGMAFDNIGNLYASTGNSNSFYRLDKSNGNATFIGNFTIGGDVEGLACLTADANNVSGKVFVDVNLDGTFDPSDVPMSGYTLQLYWDTNGNGQVDPGESLLQTTTSDVNGDYSFILGTQGNFVVVFDSSQLPPGASLTTPDHYGLTITGFGQTLSGSDFGIQQSGAVIGDRVWSDLNGNGVQDNGEPGLANAVLELWSDPDGNGNPNDGMLLATQTSAADGAYAFTGLSAGSYIIRIQSAPMGYVLTTGNDPLHVNLSPYEFYKDADFGFRVPTMFCYAASDATDELFSYDLAANTSTLIGSLGVTSVEALAVDPATGTIYATDTNILGTVDKTNGSFSAIGSGAGCGYGALGFLCFSDIDGLTFDPWSGRLYASVSRPGVDDVLIVLNPATGDFMPGVFGGNDYLPLTGGSEEIDDIAMDPMTGVMFAEAPDTLYTVDLSTGALTPVGSLGTTDMEGMGFASDGTLLGSTGDLSSQPDAMWSIDKSTGLATFLGTFSGGSDFEGVDCMTAPANRITGTVFIDANSDGLFNNSESGRPGAWVSLYLDGNNNGVIDASDTLLRQVQTDSSGNYTLGVGFSGNFIVAIDVSQFPTGTTLTTPDHFAVSFSSYGGSAPFQDFGVSLPPPVTKASNAPNSLVFPGDTLTYTITILNIDTQSWDGITVTDNLPAGVQYVASSTVVTAPVTTSNSYRDEFNAVTYSGSDGTLDWSTQPWVEFGENNGPSAGDIVITTDGTEQVLRLRDRSRGVTRQADLSGYTRALLSFAYRRQSLDSSNEYVTVEISSDGGSTWREIFRIMGPATDGSYNTFSYDISPYIASNTVIRFTTSSAMRNGDIVYIDNVNIALSIRQTTTSPGGAPPTLASGYDLNPGESMTVTFQVQVDNPLPGGLSTITNTASVATNQHASPMEDSVTDTVATLQITNPADGSSTNDSTPTFSGTSNAVGATVLVTIGTETHPAVVQADGTWSLDWPSVLSDGTYTVTAVINSSLGGSITDTIQLTIDTVPPTVIISTPAEGSTTSDGTPLITGTTSEPNAVVQITIGSQTFQTTADAAGNWSLEWPVLLSDGPYTVSAVVQDAAGNVGSDSNNFNVLRPPDLLRNDEVANLADWNTMKPSIFVNYPSTPSLDPLGPDGIPQEGEGSMQSSNGSSDDDDFYATSIPNPYVDPDPTVLNDPNRPIVVYQLSNCTNCVIFVRKNGSSVEISYVKP